MQGPPARGPRGLPASRLFRGVGRYFQRSAGASRSLRGRGLQGPSEGPQSPQPSPHTRFWGVFSGGQGPPGASRRFTRLQVFYPDFGGFPGGPPASRPSPADLLQLGARTLPGGPPGDRLKMWGATAEGLGPWVWGIPIKGKINVHCIYLAYWGGWRQGCASRCTGRARRGSIRPFSIGSSHCLTQYGGKG